MTRTTQKIRAVTAAASIRWLLILFAVWLATGPRQVHAQAAASKEYQIKAACLLNFVQFIEWPAASFQDPASPIIIGVLGDDPFGQILDQTFQDESVKGRALVVKRSRQLEELKNCHVLFVCKTEKPRVAEILTSVTDVSVVTVGELDEFARTGGIINFYIDGGKIRFEVNADGAQRKGLKIGSQLLKRARIVGSDPRKGRE
jgi:hypothetical protein